MSEKTWTLILERAALNTNLTTASFSESCREFLYQYRAKKKATKRSVRHEKRSHIDSLAREVENAAYYGESAAVNNIFKQLINRSLIIERPMRSAHGRDFPSVTEDVPTFAEELVQMGALLLNLLLHPIAPKQQSSRLVWNASGVFDWRCYYQNPENGGLRDCDNWHCICNLPAMAKIHAGNPSAPNGTSKFNYRQLPGGFQRGVLLHRPYT